MSFSSNSQYKNLTASGNGMQANTAEGDFHGQIIAIVDINNPSYPKLKKKIQIKVEGQNDLFEDLINFNDSTKEDYLKSLGFLQMHTKRAMISAGMPVNFDQEVTEDWCETQLNELASKKATVHFTQKMTAGKTGSSLKIDYIK